MANSYKRIKPYVDFLNDQNKNESLERLRPKPEKPIPLHVPQGGTWGDVKKRLDLLNASEDIRKILIEPDNIESNEAYPYKIENLIGTIKVPLGLAGPLRINGLHAQGDFYLPLATVEPTLVASYSRGAQCITASGGCTSLIIEEGVTRAPVFKFNNIIDASQFLNWVIENYKILKDVAEKTTRFGKLLDMKVNMFGNQVILVMEYSTGDAIGQNMVTIATQSVLEFISKSCPIKPNYQSVDGNSSSDKKASFQAFQSTRGKKVTAEVTIPADIVKKFLNSSPETMDYYIRMAMAGCTMQGSIGAQGHYANGLSALYIACGQDAACVAESSVGLTVIEMTSAGDLYASVTLPSIMVGTIGSATVLPSQKACLEILGINGSDTSNKLAEICAATCLAGELSLVAALAMNEFTDAHKKLARNVK